MGWVASFFSGLKAEVEWLITSLAVASGNSDAAADTPGADAAAHHEDAASAKDISIPTIADQQADNAMADHQQIAQDSEIQNGSHAQPAESATHTPANLLLNADFLIDTTEHSGPAPSPGLIPSSFEAGIADLSGIGALVGAPADQDFHVILPQIDIPTAISTPHPDAGEFALASLTQQTYTFAHGGGGGGGTANGGDYSHHDITSQGGTCTLILHLDNSLYDLSRTSPSLYASISGDLQTVVNFFASHFNDSTTDVAHANTWQMNVGWGEVSSSALAPGEVGASHGFLYAVPYSQLQTGDGTASGTGGFNGLVAAEIKAGSQAVNIPTSEPFSGSNPTFKLTGQEIHALGVTNFTGLNFGGIGFSSAPNTFFFDQHPAANEYDFMGIAIHEITEQLGRLTLNGGSGTQLTLLDLFNYVSPNTPTYTVGSGDYFSVDSGATAQQYFNGTSSGDHGDWATNTTYGNDAFDASPLQGVDLPFTYADYLTMEAVGWSGTFKFDGSVAQTTIDWNNQLGGTL